VTRGLRGLIGVGTTAAGLATIVAAASRRHRRERAHLEHALLDAAAPAGDVNLDGIDALPAPVARYLRNVLTQGQPRIRVARLRQHGKLRTRLDRERWMAFEATELVVPDAPGFVWDAEVDVAPLVHVRVRDALVDGTGSGKVLLASAVTVASQSGGHEMNASALHRYLAESVWYPTALLPSPMLAWSAVDASSALATLTAGGTSVSLTFRFNDADEIAGVDTPARWGLFDGRLRQLPWEARLSEYRRRGDCLVPMRADVGWHEGDRWEAVWRGRLLEVSYETA
jgi:hypothetical protein